MPHLRIDPSFFKKERDQAYSDWKSAMWRELFQNSIDQGCSIIRISLEDCTDTDGTPFVRLRFADNGPGMTREVLENVYFAIGATTKSGPGQIGGMGRARVLTCFAMKGYRIHSHNYEVVGQSDEYNVTDVAKPYQGCTFHIDMEETTIDEMKRKLVAFLGESRISARIMLNGEWLSVPIVSVGKYVRNFATADGVEFAKVFVNKSAKQHRVIVRVNGVAMFTTDTLAKAQVIVELDPGLSRKVLTANRDGLHWSYRPVVDSFLAELAINTNSALLPRFAKKKSVVRGGGFKTVRKQRPVSKNNNFTNDEIVAFGASLNRGLSGISANKVHSANATNPEAVANRVYVSDDTSNFVRNASYEAPVAVRRDTFVDWLNDTFGDIFVIEDTENPAVHKVVNNYYPDAWRIQEVNGKLFRKGGNIIKVLLMWHTAISYALEVGLPNLGHEEIAFSVGYLFSDTTVAEHRTETEGHLFLLNPTTAEGKLGFSVRQKNSLKKLMTSAKHEVTHVVHTWHNEDFCGLREKIDEAFDEAECFRRMKQALADMPDCDCE